MKLAVSNIAFSSGQDEQVYALMNRLGFSGLEIAPTRILPQTPYERLEQASLFQKQLKQTYHLNIVSMQSIWYGVTERIFAGDQERQVLIDYTEKAIDFAAAAGCGNLVFGCPKNRRIDHPSQYPIAVDFFSSLGEYAQKKGCVVAIEANPPIYDTNFINTTAEAEALCRQVGSPGFRINLDIGTIIENKESVRELPFDLISHVHLSEPGLLPIQKRPLHRELSDALRDAGYTGYCSVEMKNTGSLQDVADAMAYAGEVFS